MSQFSKLFEAVKNKPEEESAASKTLKQKSAPAAKPKTVEKREASKIKVSAALPPVTEKPLRSERRKGKSSSPEHTQVLTYIRKDTHKQVRKALIDDPGERDLSELVEELLADWLNRM